MTTQDKTIVALAEALEYSSRIIKTWHNMGMPDHVGEQVWQLYQSSPEMKMINETLKTHAQAIAEAKERLK